MLEFLQTTATDTELYPREDPDIVRLAAAVEPLEAAAEAAELERRRLLSELQPFDGISRPEPTDLSYLTAKQKAKDARRAYEQAQAAHALALQAATARARTAWNDKIRHAYCDDQPIRAAFIAMLTTYEAFVAEAQTAGVSGVFNIAHLFITAEEIVGRDTYARRTLGLGE